MYYGFDVVGRVINILQQIDVDLAAVTLEEAKQLTAIVIIERRRRTGYSTNRALRGMSSTPMPDVCVDMFA